MPENLGPKGSRFTSVRYVGETGSTNADLLNAARNGEAEGAVLVADHQNAGRGRQDRAWHDDPGNSMLMSFLVRPRRPTAGLLPLIAGVAAVEAVESLLAIPADVSVVGLKWPNDVLAPTLGERKLAGILAESTTAGDGSGEHTVVVVGTGMNLRWGSPPPPAIAARATTLTEVLDREVDRQEILDPYLRHVDRWLSVLENDGPVSVLEAYKKRCLTLGRHVRFETPGAEYVGTAIDISPSGMLILELAGGEWIELSAGDAHHVPG